MNFLSFNQFDKRFKEIGKFSDDRTACPIFSLITAKKFMDDGIISKEQHENNIYSAVTNYLVNNIPKYISFEELLNFCNEAFSEGDILATTPELITQHIVGYEHIFKPDNYNQNYGVIFLKNRNYICVLYKYDQEESLYCVRDSHESTQYNFKTFEELRNHLNNVYQFEQLTIVDGVIIPEFSNIECLTVDKPFDLVGIDADLHDENDDVNLDIIDEEDIDDKLKKLEDKLVNKNEEEKMDLDTLLAYQLMAEAEEEL